MKQRHESETLTDAVVGAIRDVVGPGKVALHEPSFEGKKSDVSQTKGIIYHFQHYQDDGNDWKKLFFDIAK